MKILNKLAYLVLIGVFFLLAYIGYYFFYPFKVIDIKNSPYPVITKQVKAGEDLIFHVEFCKYMSVPSKTTLQLVDGVIISLESMSAGSSPEGCYDVNVSQTIPALIKPGFYKLRITADHEIHPVLRTVRVQAETQVFEVVE